MTVILFLISNNNYTNPKMGVMQEYKAEASERLRLENSKSHSLKIYEKSWTSYLVSSVIL